MGEVRVDVPLRAGRDYVLGPDVFDGAARTLGVADGVLVLNRKVTGPFTLLPYGENSSAEAWGEFSGGNARYHIFAASGQGRVAGAPPDHDAIMEGAVCTDDEVVLSAASGGESLASRMAAALLELLDRRLPGVEWLLMELALSAPGNGSAAVSVRLAATPGNRFAKGVALADGRPLGHIVLARAPAIAANDIGEGAGEKSAGQVEPITEDALRRIVVSVISGLSAAHLGPDVLFEDLGIDSLDHARILIAIEEEFGFRVSDHDFDRCSSITAILAYMTDGGGIWL